MSLLIVNILTAYQAESAFRQFIQGQDAYGFRVLPTPKEIQMQLRLESDFRDRLYQSIVIVSILAMIGALIIGVSLAQLITSPMRALKKGMQALREKKSSKIELTGNEEFDEVITEFNKLSDELSFQEKLRSNLIADISHEFKTPLTALTGQIHGIRDGIFKADTKRFELINEQIERLTELVNSLQQYTHMQSELRNLKKQKINLLDTLKSHLEIYKQDLVDKKINLDLVIPKDLSIRANKQKFLQLTDNLVKNTITYSGATKLTIQMEKEQSKLVFRDNGKGVDEKSLKLIFERFFRVEQSRNRKTGGLGLGLTIVKDIAEAHGWDIAAKSPKDQGLTIEIYMGKQSN